MEADAAPHPVRQGIRFTCMAERAASARRLRCRLPNTNWRHARAGQKSITLQISSIMYLIGQLTRHAADSPGSTGC
jgi:hypothetical protein